MAKISDTEVKFPFNLRGDDALLFSRLRDALELRLGTRLNAVQVVRMAIQSLARKERIS